MFPYPMFSSFVTGGQDPSPKDHGLWHYDVGHIPSVKNSCSWEQGRKLSCGLSAAEDGSGPFTWGFFFVWFSGPQGLWPCLRLSKLPKQSLSEQKGSDRCRLTAEERVSLASAEEAVGGIGSFPPIPVLFHVSGGRDMPLRG